MIAKPENVFSLSMERSGRVIDCSRRKMKDRLSSVEKNTVIEVDDDGENYLIYG